MSGGRRVILVTGATDGLGRLLAGRLAAAGHRVLVHGRDPGRVARVVAALRDGGGEAEGYVADLAGMARVAALAEALCAREPRLDVLVNNAGVFRTDAPLTAEGLELRFAVNTLAPYLLTRRLLDRLPADGRVVNVASAAQAPADPAELVRPAAAVDDFTAYARSKLALIQWTRHLAAARGGRGPVPLAVNPGSLLDTKMVREAFGRARRPAEDGAEVLMRAVLDPAFARPGGYFDGDAGRFAPPHPAARDAAACARLVAMLDAVLARLGIDPAACGTRREGRNGDGARS